MLDFRLVLATDLDLHLVQETELDQLMGSLIQMVRHLVELSLRVWNLAQLKYLAAMMGFVTDLDFHLVLETELDQLMGSLIQTVRHLVEQSVWVWNLVQLKDLAEMKGFVTLWDQSWVIWKWKAWKMVELSVLVTERDWKT